MGRERNPGQRQSCTQGSGAPWRGAACRPRNPRASPLWQCASRHAKELREAGLVNHGSDGYVVTPAGLDLLKRLGELPAFATKWVASQAKKKS